MSRQFLPSLPFFLFLLFPSIYCSSSNYCSSSHHFFSFRCVDVDSTISIPSADVTFLDANHCPGAVLLLFKIREGKASQGAMMITANNEVQGDEGDEGDKWENLSKMEEGAKKGTSGDKGRGRKVDKVGKGSKGGGGNEGYSKIYLHTGDMRYHPKMKKYPALQNIKIDKIFLDTTYAHPKHKVSTSIS
jgi:hypothetical protein